MIEINDQEEIDQRPVAGQAILWLLVCAVGLSFVGAYLGFWVAKMHGISDLTALIQSEDPQVLDVTQRNGIRYYNLISHLFVFTLASLLTAFLVARRRVARFLYLDQSINWASVGWVALIMLAAFPLMQVVYWLNQQLPLPQWMWEMEEQQGWLIEEVLRMESPAEFLLAFLVAAIAPAVGEELLFRGVLQPRIQELTKRPHLAVWLTAILFSAIHLQFAGFIPRMVLGALLGYLLLWTRSLWAPILAHLLFNGVQIIAVYVMGDEMQTDAMEDVAITDLWMGLPAMLVLYWAVGKLRKAV